MQTTPRAAKPYRRFRKGTQIPFSSDLLKSWIVESEKQKREITALALLIGFQCARKGLSATETMLCVRRIF